MNKYLYHENLIPELIFYHGSDKKVDIIEPLSFSAGHKFRKPSWAVFMFRQKELALSFAVGMHVVNKCEKSNIKYSLVSWVEKDGFMHYKPIMLGSYETFSQVKQLVNGDKVYVYTLKAPIDSNLNIIGTTGTLPEYVYSGTPKMIKREEIIIDDELLDNMVTLVDHEDLIKIKKSKPHKKNIVGPWIDFFVDFEKRTEMRNKVIEKMKNGELQPGDDLGFLDESYKMHLWR